jgi:RNA polymerase primary sigma factor
MIHPIDKAPCGPNPAPAPFAGGTFTHRLSRDEVRLLATRIADGDREARNLLVQANLGLVVRVARHYVGRGLMMDDLVGEGNLGLIRAAEDFDPQVGTHFSTYATYWIKESILRALMNTTATIRLPAHMFRLLIKWSRTERSLGRAYGRAPTMDEIASAMGLNEHQKDLLAKARHARGLRLESGLSVGPRPWLAAEMMDSHEAPEALIEADEERRCLLEGMGRLDNRERTVLILRYGLGSEPPMNYNEIGRRLGVTREWVRKIAKQTIEKLVEGSVADPVPPHVGRRTKHLKVSTARVPRPDASGSPSGLDQQPVAASDAMVAPDSSHECPTRCGPEAGLRTQETRCLAWCG